MSTSEVRANGFSVTTVIAATPDRVYRAWTVQDDVNGWLATESEIDARVGGSYVLKWPTPEGELSARGEYLELEPGKRIVQTWESWGPQGRFAGMDATVTVEFRELGNGTTEMTQSETSPAYADPERIEMSRGGTIEAHKALQVFIGSPAAG